MDLDFLLCLGLTCSVACAQVSSTQAGPPSTDELPPNSSEQRPITPIDAERVCADVRALADDALSGRGAGYAGEVEATRWIAQRFEELGLEPVGDGEGALRGWFQAFEFQPQSPPVPWQILRSRNVVAYLGGRDEKLAQEIVVLGAHHDGQGRMGEADGDRLGLKTAGQDEIWNSADDDASGVAALLEIARVLTHAPLRRSVLFVTFGAEEHALNGAAHYVEEPAFAWNRHVAMIELEKLGRMPGQLPITASSGTSTAWARATRCANDATGMEVVSAIDEIIDDADHYPFAAAGLPAIVFGVVHEEDTHRPSDEFDRIACADLAQRTEYALTLLRALDSFDARPTFAIKPRRDAGMLLVSVTPAELDARGVPADEGGAKVSTVLRGLPADRAGVSRGDLLVSIGGRRIPRTGSVRRTLDDALAGTGRTLTVEILRGEHRRVLEIEIDP